MSTTFKIENGDFIANSATGRFISVSGRDAFKQELGENLGINRLANGFGADIVSLSGSLPVDDSTFVMLLNNRIRDSIDAFKQLQSTYDVERVQGELIAGISFLNVVQDKSDPRVYLYYLDVATRAGPQVRASGSVVR